MGAVARPPLGSSPFEAGQPYQRLLPVCHHGLAPWLAPERLWAPRASRGCLALPLARCRTLSIPVLCLSTVTARRLPQLAAAIALPELPQSCAASCSLVPV
jgi:hypothetical protein